MALSSSSKQSLLTLIKAHITYLEDQKARLKEQASIYYELANKDDPETIYQFKYLNEVRSERREVSSIIKKLAKFSKELKQELRHNV